MTFYRQNKLIIIGGLVAIVILAVIYIFYADFLAGANVDYLSPSATTTPVYKPVVLHLKTPEPLKGVYLTACAASTPSLRNHVIALIEQTELNAVIVDLKDYSGTVAFPTVDPSLQNPAAGGCRVPNLKELVEEWHKKDIYIIGRITIFQDPYYSKTHPELAVKKADGVTVWKDKKGLSFIQVGAKPYWDHVIALSKEAYNLGIDEINFDYIRFPSDGNMVDISFPLSQGKSKPEALEDFFKYLHQGLEGTGIVMSADLFGMTTTVAGDNDLNIGQVFVRALPYFDYLAPMIYPSHYPPHFYNYPNPNKVPYEIIKIALDGAVAKTLAASSTPTKIRPWLQDFDYGGNYGVPEVKAQIKATYDAGVTSWMIWDPANKYTPAAYEPVN